MKRNTGCKKAELKKAFSAIVDLDGNTAMHLALATADYPKLDLIDEPTLLELLNDYLSVQEAIPPANFTEQEFYEDEEDDIYG